MSSTGEPEPTRSRPAQPGGPHHPGPPPPPPEASEPGEEPTRVQPSGPPPAQAPAAPTPQPSQQPGYQPAGGPGFGPPVGGPPPQRSGGGKGWLWALGGALVASLVWGAVLAVLLLSGSLGLGGPSLGDYEYADDLCKSVDVKPFEESGYSLPEDTGENESQVSRGNDHDAIGSMSCFTTLTGESSGNAYHYTWTDLHKKTDPEPEFEARYLAYDEYDEVQGTKYTVKELSDLGDQAFLVTQTTNGEYVGGEVIIGILDGGLTYQGTWNAYSSTGATGGDADEIGEQLREVAEKTLENLEG